MPAQRGKSMLAAKYGSKLDETVKAHAEDPTDYGIVKLPPGITNGVAKLKKCYFAEFDKGDNKGEFYFRASGVIIEPHSVTLKDGTEVRVAGLQTSIMIPICDTKDRSTPPKVTRQDEHVAKAMNVMRALAGEEYTHGATNAAALESMAEELEKVSPYFNFSTSESKPRLHPVTGKALIDPATGKAYEPRIWENWHGSKNLVGYVPPSGAPINDGSGEVNESDTTVAAPPKKAHSKNSMSPPKALTKVAPATPDFDEFGDLDSWAERAENADEEAVTYLTEKAIEAGYDEEVIKRATKWADVVVMIQNPIEDGAEHSPDTNGEPTVEKGTMWYYKIMDKNKKVRKAEVEAVAINDEKKTATLKDTTTKVTYRDVAWDKLEPIPQD